MCGIGGIALRPGATISAREILARMVELQHHRGPDGNGILLRPDGGFGFCHNRLAILDLSDAGAQPMVSDDGRLTVTFNGEIYNWQELRRSLESEGVVFRTRTDTEVLLEAYRRHGVDVSARLRGMFAFAIHDGRDGTIFCSRDRVGKKPFVYAETPAGVCFASEIPAVQVFPDCDSRFNYAAIAGMLLHNVRHIPDPYTAFAGIKRLRPGHSMLIREGRVERIWRYWQPEASNGAVSPGRLRALLEDAVSLRMVADVPVGALLSGGVDSSAIVHMMQRRASEPVRTYALGLDKDDEDLRRARSFAAQVGVIHKEFYFEPRRQLEDFKRMLEV
ncbi:MAG: asparagine synthase (glutamine-hydrolyzing), partial [Candidatus Sericytochromatia bacterium]|nr:asparagine synthase (glutamine-hydrolyzing) [Candidatus Tanganyikabacteria bacterium]